MAGKRWYADSCGMAQGLNVVGERWALHVVRELVLGPKRFADLRGDLPGISSNVLTQRLIELENRGVLRRRRLPLPAATWVYELTEWGAELEPVIIALGRWGTRSPVFDGESGISCSSAVLSMRTMFRAEAADGLDLTVGFRLGEREVQARVAGAALEVGPVDGFAAPDDGGPSVVADTTPNVLGGLLYDGLDLDEAQAAGEATVEGDRAALERYLACFWLPERAASGARETGRQS